MTRILYALLTLTLVPVLQTSNPVNEFSPELLLKPKTTTARFTIPANTDARTSFERLADGAGLNIVFYRGFVPDTPALLRLENATIVDAFNQTAAQTGNFWFPWNSSTVIVAPDNPQVRAAIEPRLTKAIYMDSGWTPNNINFIMNVLRDRYQFRNIFQNEDARAFLIRDTPARVALAEEQITLVSSGLPRPTSDPLSYPEANNSFLSIAEKGVVRKVVPSNRAHLEKTLAGGVSIDMTDSPQAIFENLAERAGLNVVFDNRMKALPSARFHLDKSDLLDALDLLALQSGTIWQPVNESTLFVMEDSTQNRRELDPMVVKVLYLTNGASREKLFSILNGLRTSVALRNVWQNSANNAIVIKDTPLRVFVAEKFISDLDRGGVRPPSVTIKPQTSSFLTSSGWVLRTAAEARSKLNLKLRGNTTIRMKETPRAAFEALAKVAELELAKDSEIAAGPEAPLNLNGVDIPDALDLLSLQTRHFWQVVDEHTIRVLLNTDAVRRNLEPRELRRFTPADSTKEGLEDMLNALRLLFGLGEAAVEENTIVVKDTADNLALVQVLIDILGKPAKN